MSTFMWEFDIVEMEIPILELILRTIQLNYAGIYQNDSVCLSPDGTNEICILLT